MNLFCYVSLHFVPQWLAMFLVNITIAYADSFRTMQNTNSFCSQRINEMHIKNINTLKEIEGIDFNVYLQKRRFFIIWKRNHFNFGGNTKLLIHCSPYFLQI